jgi:hypothetical protein
MTPLGFSATTLRVTSIDDERFLTTIGEFVLTDIEAHLETSHETLESVERRYGSGIFHSQHPDEWEELKVTIQGTALPRLFQIDDSLQDATVTSECALEAWGPQSGDGYWPVLVVPCLSFHTMGFSGILQRDLVTFRGSLYPGLWGVHVAREHRPWASDGRKRPFVGALPVEPGKLWHVGATRVPPPDEGPVPLKVTAYGEVPGALLNRWG